MANAQRLLELATHIEKLPETVIGHNSMGIPRELDAFEMDRYSYCGTPQCIAGHAVYKWTEGAKVKAIAYNFDWFDRAQNLLELSELEAQFLFYAHGHPKGITHVTRAEAARALQRLASGWPPAQIWEPEHDQPC